MFRSHGLWSRPAPFVQKTTSGEATSIDPMPMRSIFPRVLFTVPLYPSDVSGWPWLAASARPRVSTAAGVSANVPSDPVSSVAFAFLPLIITPSKRMSPSSPTRKGKTAWAFVALGNADDDGRTGAPSPDSQSEEHVRPGSRGPTHLGPGFQGDSES